MFGRRSHTRFSVTPSAVGALRVLRDVILQRSGPNEVVAIGREAGVLGEILTLQLAGDDTKLGIAVRVLDSRPIVIDGAVRHRLRLERVAAVADASAEEGVDLTTVRVPEEQ
jgi:hypothetical protein